MIILTIATSVLLYGAISGMSFDFISGPILSERNPNGTIDYWYLFNNAEKAQ